jgi:hypothetical protein
MKRSDEEMVKIWAANPHSFELEAEHTQRKFRERVEAARAKTETAAEKPKKATRKRTSKKVARSDEES